MIESYTKKEVALIANKRRDEYIKLKFRRGLYTAILDLILQYARSGKTAYIHPVDRMLWNNEEIDYTIWKLREQGFACTHKYHSKLSDWLRTYTNNREQLIIDWEINAN